jgi:hypothetical protein
MTVDGNLELVGRPLRVGDGWWLTVQSDRRRLRVSITSRALDRLQGRQDSEDVLNTHDYAELIPLLAKEILAIVARKLSAYSETGLVIDEADVV